MEKKSKDEGKFDFPTPDNGKDEKFDFPTPKLTQKQYEKIEQDLRDARAEANLKPWRLMNSAKPPHTDTD